MTARYILIAIFKVIFSKIDKLLTGYWNKKFAVFHIHWQEYIKDWIDYELLGYKCEHAITHCVIN